MTYSPLFSNLYFYIQISTGPLNSSQTETAMQKKLSRTFKLPQPQERGWGDRVFLLAKLEVTHWQCSPRYKGRSESVICSVLYNSLQPYELQPARLLCPWDSPGKNTGVGCHALLQGIFATQGSNLDFPHWRLIPYRVSQQESYKRKGREQRIWLWVLSGGEKISKYPPTFSSTGLIIKARELPFYPDQITYLCLRAFLSHPYHWLQCLHG